MLYNIHLHPISVREPGVSSSSYNAALPDAHIQVQVPYPPAHHLQPIIYPSSTCSYCCGSRCSHNVPCSAALLLAMAGNTPSIWPRLLFMLSMWLPICCDSVSSSSSFRSYTAVSTHSNLAFKSHREE